MGASNHHFFRRWCVAALAIVAACGGTTGFGDPMGVLGDDAASEPDVSVASDGSVIESATGADVTSAAPLDAGGAGADAQGGDPLDATMGDRTVPMRPPPRDTGAPLVVGDASGADAHDAGSADVGSVWSPDGQTTYTILAAQGCLKLIDGSPDPNSCPASNGCLAPATGGGNCEQTTFPPGTGEIGDPRTNCLQTLHDIVTSKCASLVLTACLCGDADNSKCLSGDPSVTPNGPVYPDYVRSFHSTAGSTISTNFVDPTFGAGAGNAVASCLGSFTCHCLGDDAGP
jgi:hypothetical protein